MTTVKTSANTKKIAITGIVIARNLGMLIFSLLGLFISILLCFGWDGFGRKSVPRFTFEYEFYKQSIASSPCFVTGYFVTGHFSFVSDKRTQKESSMWSSLLKILRIILGVKWTKGKFGFPYLLKLTRRIFGQFPECFSYRSRDPLDGLLWL